MKVSITGTDYAGLSLTILILEKADPSDYPTLLERWRQSIGFGKLDLKNTNFSENIFVVFLIWVGICYLLI